MQLLRNPGPRGGEPMGGFPPNGTMRRNPAAYDGEVVTLDDDDDDDNEGRLGPQPAATASRDFAGRPPPMMAGGGGGNPGLNSGPPPWQSAGMNAYNFDNSYRR